MLFEELQGDVPGGCGVPGSGADQPRRRLARWADPHVTADAAQLQARRMHAMIGAEQA